MELNNTKLAVPDGILEKVCCAICTNYLSVFPIHLSATLGSICGRCSISNVPDALHNSVYEAVVSELRFPCCNRIYGCEEYRLPSKLPEHEQTCKYRHVNCPSSSHLKCQWFGPCTQLQDHYEAEHPIFLMKQSDFEVNFINTFDGNYLFLYSDEIFIFRRRADGNSNTLYCCLLYFGGNAEPGDFKYQITLTNGTDNTKKTFDKKATTCLDQNITKIVAAEVYECLNNPLVIVGSVEIIDKEEEVQDLKQVPEPNKYVLSVMRCRACFEYMIPPIYQCLRGHSVCAICKNAISECPLCKASIKDTRNFILEGVVACLQYPCKNRDNGCTYIAEPAATKKHEKLCAFCLYECPLKEYVACSFKSNLEKLHKHIMAEHHENILKIDTVHIPTNRDNPEADEGYILRHLDRLFILHFKIEHQVIFWSLQLIGPPEHAKKYAYQVEVIDNVNRINGVYLKGPCGSLTSKVACFNRESYFRLNIESVENFFTDTFSFQLRVLRE